VGHSNSHDVSSLSFGMLSMSEMAYYLTFLLLCSSTDKTDGIWMELTAGSSLFGLGGGCDRLF
jgi:hypothetical protein